MHYAKFFKHVQALNDHGAPVHIVEPPRLGKSHHRISHVGPSHHFRTQSQPSLQNTRIMGLARGKISNPYNLQQKNIYIYLYICPFTFDPQWNEPFQPVNSRNQNVGDLVLTSPFRVYLGEAGEVQNQPFTVCLEGWERIILLTSYIIISACFQRLEKPSPL